jgi:hypothetical protein
MGFKHLLLYNVGTQFLFFSNLILFLDQIFNKLEQMLEFKSGLLQNS